MSGEKEFRKWITTTAPKDWMMQTIETSTGTGIPDLFYCVHGYQGWAELKSTASSHCYMRISQWPWFFRLTSRGGFAVLIIKRLKDKRIDMYLASHLTRLDASECELKGKDIYFPSDKIKPVFSYKLGSGNSKFYEKWQEIMEKDYE